MHVERSNVIPDDLWIDYIVETIADMARDGRLTPDESRNLIESVIDGEEMG